jgi:hypothetical protein
MEDDTTSVCAALFGLAGFEILSAADAGGELELLVQRTRLARAAERAHRPLGTIGGFST